MSRIFHLVIAGMLFFSAAGLMYRSFSAGEASARILYVDAAGGNDANDGRTIRSAWKTSARVNAALTEKAVQAGDTISFRCGGVYAGELALGISGEDARPVVIGTHGDGAAPVLDAVSHQYGIVISGSRVTIEGIQVSNARVAAFRIADGVSRLVVRDCSIRSTVTMTTPAGILFDGDRFSDIAVERTVFQRCSDAAIEIGGPSQVTGLTLTEVSADSCGHGFSAVNADLAGIRISDCRFDRSSGSGIRLSRTRARDLVISGGGCSENREHGVYLNGDLASVQVTGLAAESNGGHGLFIDPFAAEGIRIENCRFTGAKNERNGLALDGRGTDIRIADTTASRNSGDGFNVHGSWQSVLMERCVADENGTDGKGWDGDGYTFHEDSAGRMVRCTARNNKKSAVAHVHRAALDMERCIFTHETNGTIPLVYLSGTRYSLINCVLFSPGRTGTGLLCVEGAITVRNTIISGFDAGFENQRATVAADHNIVFGARTTAWKNTPPGTGSLAVDPEFSDPRSLDFTLRPDSPGIDAGVDAGSVSDFTGRSVPRGKAPDIGAHER